MYLMPARSRGRGLSYYLVTGQHQKAPGLSGLGSTLASRRALNRVFVVQRRGRRLNGLGDTQYDIEGNPIPTDYGDGSYSLPMDTVQPTNPITSASGVPAGVVTQLWPASRAAAGTGTGIAGWLSSNLGLVAAVGGGLILLGAIRKK
jgi:hypothetical protein